MKPQKFSLDKINIYSKRLHANDVKKFDRLKPILLKETNNAYFERHPGARFKQIGVQADPKSMLIKDAWKTPIFADFKFSVNDWAKTPVYLMAVEGKSDAAALVSQLPVPAIKRLIFDCSDQQKDRELELH